MNKKISTQIAIGIILILVVIVGSFTLWQRAEITKEENRPLSKIQIPGKEELKDEIIGWETYRNYEHLYEMDYPEGWYVEEDEGAFPRRDNKFDLIRNDSIIVAVLCEPKPDSNLKEWLENRGIIEYKESTRDGLEWLEVTKKSKDTYEDKFLSNENKICSFFLFFETKELPINNEEFREKEEEGRSIFNQMLSTFKFIEEETQLSPNTIANFVYLTDIKYDGNLGGRLGADEKCVPPAGLNCKPGTIHAFITVDSNDSIIKMDKNYNFNENLSIYWFNKDTKKAIILAENWSEMINEDIINDQKDGTGKGEWSGDFPWTGGKGNAGYLDSCNKWTTNEGDPSVGSGFHGIIGGTDKTYWLSSDGWAGISMVTVCANKRYLRCICEGSIRQ